MHRDHRELYPPMVINMTNAIRNLLVCENCDSAIYLRTENDTQICECGLHEIVGVGNMEFSVNKTMKSTSGCAEHHNVILRTTDKVLDDDYHEIKDRRGVIKNATAALAALHNYEGKPLILKKAAPYEDYSAIIEHDIEHRLRLKEKDLVTIHN